MGFFSKNTNTTEDEKPTLPTEPIEPKHRFELIETCKIGIAATIMVYYDTVTKVMYQTRFEGEGHISPIYNPDGTLALYEEES